MAHTIMFIPATIKADTQPNTQYLEEILAEKNIRSAIYPNFNLETIEQLLGSDRTEELLETIARQREALALNKDVVLIQGISLTKPYAAGLNFSIATTLGAAIIFEITTEQNLETALRQLKIIINPYKLRYKQPILGFVINQNNLQETSLIKKYKNLFDLQLPLLGIFPYKPESAQKASGIYCVPETGINCSFDFSFIQKILDKPAAQPITPPIFKYKLIDLACSANKKIILPEGDEPRTLRAVNICAARGIAECILLGEKNKIYAACDKLGIKLHEKISIIEPQAIIEKYVTPLYEARRAKGMTLDVARTQLADNVMLGTMMLHLGEVDGLISGAVHTTANTIRPAFQIIKLAPHAKIGSSVFFMCLPDQVVLFADCAINPNPSVEELADIAIQTADTAADFGIPPKVAMLSYSTGTSGAGPSVDKVKAATEIVKTLRPDLAIEGPTQYDAAISKEVALIKAPNSKIAGEATVFIMPNLDVGNIAYKVVQHNTGIVCIGPMLQGLRKPVNDLSRGCTADDIVFTIAITAIQALRS